MVAGRATDDDLPVNALREIYLATRGPIVITAPTGSGKSTQVPRWAAQRGPVVVVEPRRVACRALASRVASLEGSALGKRIGYQVRDENRISPETVVRFVTPGIALRQMNALKETPTVILDELHERRLDVDLLLALLMNAPKTQLVAMSATLDGPRVAAHLGGTLLQADGRLHPVDIRHHDAGETLPNPRDLDRRIAEVVRTLDAPGDVLVFLPGKAEIAAAELALRSLPVDLVPLHGGLSLDAQSRVFEPTKRRKVVLSTNVAETSLTVPGIGVVIDSGLVRRTSYHRGRAHLALLPIAQDAADQRAGRAGRTGPGVCIRLWARRGALEERTPPEIHRESLVPLLLSAAACGHPDVERLPLLDPPKDGALEDARDELRALGAIDAAGAVTGAGRQLFGLPIDASLGRLIVEARAISEREEDETVLQDVVDLVAALSSGRRFFHGPPELEDPIRVDACDASALVRAVRFGGASVDRLARRDAESVARRLRAVLSLPSPSHEDVDARRLREVALGADARNAHVVRRRSSKKSERFAFANGGTELQLARESAVWKALDVRPGEVAAEAIVVFDVRAFGTGKDRRLLATCASPCDLPTLRDAGLGRPRLARTWVKKKRVLAEIEIVFAKKVLATREEVPVGEVARAAIVDLLKRGSLFKKSIRETKVRLDARALAAQLSRSSVGQQHGLPEGLEAPPSFDEWVVARVEELGIERGDELALLSEDDFLAQPLPYELQGMLEDLFPRTVSLGDATYQVEFDLPQARAVLTIVKGDRTKPPPRSFLPAFPGLRVFVEAGRTLHEVR